jgi:membrane protein
VTAQLIDVAMLLWFGLTSMMTLVAASWIAVSVEDRHDSLYESARV